MPNSHFVPAPGNYGEIYVLASRELPATVITASTTNTFPIPISASPVAAFKALLFYKGGRLEVMGAGTPSFAGTTTARVIKRSSAGTVTALSESVTLTTGAGGVQFTKYIFPILTTATDAALTISPNDGDSLCVEVTAGAGAVTTQPTSVGVGIRLAVLR